ncbi:MAG: hypothetical protein ACYTG0_45140, partial [Planctomycetota bacterium]
MCSPIRALLIVSACAGVVWTRATGSGRADDAPEVPRIDSVVMSSSQLQQSDEAVVWYDDFDGPEKPYTESQGRLDDNEAFGGQGRSMLSVYEKGTRGVGNRKVFFGDGPTGKVVRKGESFDDVYWRIYVKHQHGWTGGGPAKLSRATSIVSPRWAQAMIAHVWSSGEALTLDPASGVRGDRVVTTRYNDFPNLRWLGNKPASQLKLHSTEEAGRWVSVEARAKLNTPGKKDGLNQLWIDGRLEAQRKNLDWRGTYTGHGINAVFLETYWNSGSPVTQKRWIDNFVISTRPIGPIVCPRNPVLIKTPYQGPGKQAAWEVEIASDDHGGTLVWQSNRLTMAERIKVSEDT